MRPAFPAVLALVLVASVLVPLEAQVDPATALVGRWDGEMRKLHPKQNLATAWTLVIEQMREQDGKWIVESAKFGETGKALRPMQVKVRVSGGKVTVAFNPPRSSIILRLVREGSLVGSVTVGTVGTTPMEFTKVK